MAYGLAERCAAYVAHGQKRYLIIEVDEAFHNYRAGARTALLLRHLPGRVYLVGSLDQALAMAAAGHHGLHHAGKSDALHGSVEFLLCLRELVGRGGELQLLGGELADLAAVHGDEGGAGGGHHVPALFLQLDERRSGYRLDFGNDIVGLFFLHHLAERLAVQHGEYVRLVGYMHRRGVGIFVTGHYGQSVTLEFNHHLFAKFAAA